jgi:hypothetical protein
MATAGESVVRFFTIRSEPSTYHSHPAEWQIEVRNHSSVPRCWMLSYFTVSTVCSCNLNPAASAIFPRMSPNVLLTWVSMDVLRPRRYDLS